MLKAFEIKGLIPEKGDLLLSFRIAEDGRLCVMVHPRYQEKKLNNVTDAGDAIEKARSPLVITATTEELDGKFMEILSQDIARRRSFEEALNGLDESTQEALKQAKEACNKKLESAKKSAARTVPSPKKAEGTEFDDSTESGKNIEAAAPPDKKDSLIPTLFG